MVSWARFTLSRLAPRRRHRSRGWRASLPLLLALGFGVPAFAQDKIVLKASHLFPNDLYIWKQGPQVMLDEIEKASNGRVKFEVYPAGQLGKDTMAALQSGLADVALLVPSYTPNKFPLSSVSELPGLYHESCEGTEKLWRIAKPGGLLHEAEYAPSGVRLLMVNALPPYVITTTTKPTEKLEALQGLKLRANGNSMKKAIAALGAVPVQVPTTEFYDALSRGTIDGGLNSYTAMPDYDLEKQLKFSVQGPRLGGGAVVLGMRKNRWDALPADIKQIFETAAANAQKHMCEWEESKTAEVRAKIVAQNGHTVVKLSPEETARWEKRVSDVVTSWLQEIKAAGKDGQAILNAYHGQ